MTCFDDANFGVEVVLVNSMLSRLCCSYKRNKDFQKEIEDFDYSLDCIWISKSIKQLKDITEEIMQQIPKFEDRRLPSCHSVIKDDNHSVNDRSHNYWMNSVVPMIQIEKMTKFQGKLLDLSYECINGSNGVNSIMKRSNNLLQIEQNKNWSSLNLSMISDLQDARKTEKHDG